jgi:hypothetical protein
MDLNEYVLITDISELKEGEEYYIKNIIDLPVNYNSLYKLENLTLLPNFNEIYYFINIDNINIYLQLLRIDISRMNIITSENTNPGYYYELTTGKYKQSISLYTPIHIYKPTTTEYVLK